MLHTLTNVSVGSGLKARLQAVLMLLSCSIVIGVWNERVVECRHSHYKNFGAKGPCPSENISEGQGQKTGH